VPREGLEKGQDDVTNKGVEEDDDIRAALAWFASVSGNTQAFVERLEGAQQAYCTATSSSDNLGQDLNLDAISKDVVGAYLAQAKSLLDDRRSYDLALASHIVPWVKQIGRNISLLSSVPGASERAVRMLTADSVAPDGAIFELALAGNYATDGFDVAFIEETKGQAKTPDLLLSPADLTEPICIECKRLKRGQYDIQEQVRHRDLFRKAAELIDNRRLSVHVDVTYTRELREVPDSYLADHLTCALSSRVITQGVYPWRDEYGTGEVRPANLGLVRQDIHNGSLYFGTKLARLLCGQVVRENGYHLAAGANPDRRDPRYIESISYGSVVTWQCIAPAAIDKKARYVKSKLAEADRQLKAHGYAIAHLAMDMELQCESSDLRRARNIETISAFKAVSKILAIYVHYLVPRISESQTWILDETVDSFGPGYESVPLQMIFPSAQIIDNELPAWKQEVPLYK
jgi:hypothetical protein